MIEITDRFTSITAGTDPVASPTGPEVDSSRKAGRRTPTGARVTLEFDLDLVLPPDQAVRVRYEFGDHGIQREGVGIARMTHQNARWGRAVVYHYRLSHWIRPDELQVTSARTVRQRTEEWESPREHVRENR